MNNVALLINIQVALHRYQKIPEKLLKGQLEPLKEELVEDDTL